MSERQIDRDRFLEEGYLVVRGVIPPGDLDAVREAYERLVDVQRGIWSGDVRGRRPAREACGRPIASRGCT